MSDDGVRELFSCAVKPGGVHPSATPNFEPGSAIAFRLLHVVQKLLQSGVEVLILRVAGGTLTHHVLESLDDTRKIVEEHTQINVCRTSLGDCSPTIQNRKHVRHVQHRSNKGKRLDF